MELTDENAFGLLVAFHDIEDVEYGSEPAEFTARFMDFRSLALQEASKNPLGEGAIALDFGHAVYFEIGDGDQSTDPIVWLRTLCIPLREQGFELTAVVAHGGRWTDASAGTAPALQTLEGGYQLLRMGHPSEPLRRALYAEASSHGSDGEDGWGSGLFVDTDAIEALGKLLKNAPTPLSAAGATFYRLSLPR